MSYNMNICDCFWETGVNNNGIGANNNQYYISDTSKKLTIQYGTGKIGISTDTPISIMEDGIEDNIKLDINGSINLSGNIYKNGNLLDLSVYQLSSTAFNGDYNSLTGKPDLTQYALTTSLNTTNDNFSALDTRVTTLETTGVETSLITSDINITGSIYTNNFSLNDSTTDAILRVNSYEAGKSIIKLATPSLPLFGSRFTSKCNVVLQAIGKNTFGRADFVIGVGNTADNLSTSDPYDTNSQRMRIYYNSYTELWGTGSTSTGTTRYFNSGGGLYSTTAYFSDCALRVNGSILGTSWFGSQSSIKIKKDVEYLDDTECLNKLLLLQPKKYRYIDESKNFDPNKKVYGFIAEEVKEVLPEAVDDTTPSLIPNIYLMGSVSVNILTLEKELELNIEYTCYIEGEDDDEGNPTAKEIKIKILEKLNENTYKIDAEINGKIFVYGKTEERFNSLKKEYFHALTISAVQELHRTITRQQEEINNLKNKLNSILSYLDLPQ